MKSVYIIAGGILVMITVVFLAPKKKTATIAEEKTSSQLDELDAYILKEYGPILEKLSTEDKELVRQEISDHLAREKAEIKKYGRLLTDEERYQLEWQAEVKARKEAQFAELYAEQKDWIDNFPFRPGYHPNIVFDPENNIAHSPEKMQAYRKELEKKVKEAQARYDAKDEECWKYQNDPELRYKLREERRLLGIAIEEARKTDPKIKEQQRILDRHKQLAGFYAQEYRYRPEFEQAYRIFEEEGLADNPIRLAHTMVGLENYFVTSRQASQHGLDKLHPVQTRTYTPTGNHNLHTNRIIGSFHSLDNSQSRRPDSRPKRQRITWGELMEEDFRIVRNCVRSEWVAAPGEERPSVELAERIRDRLVAEIPHDGFTGQTFLFGLADPKDHELVPGQSLLAE